MFSEMTLKIRHRRLLWSIGIISGRIYNTMNHTKTRKLIYDSLLAGIALAMYLIELQIPSPVPIPGVKLGLANIVTLFAVYLLNPADAAAILMVRILLGGIFSGRLISLLYSLAGGIFCLLVMLLLKKNFLRSQIWLCSVAGAAAHNIGQIMVAILLTRSIYVAVYLPVLLVTGMTAGLFTGLCSQRAISLLKKHIEHFREEC